ncbi:MAG: sulfatase-like hydrolase/transferase [Pseudomonadota bacterium]
MKPKHIALVLIAVLAVALLGWSNRKAIILHLITTMDKAEVGPPRDIVWDQGPEQPIGGQSDQRPNIVFILVDDLGINDISTFGGGVAGGLVPTPNINRLANEGALFTNAYSGTGTCAQSRATLMTGRYPSRTGFEFTPTPDGMGRMVALFGNDMRETNDVPPIIWNRAASEAGTTYAEQGLPSSEVTVAETLRDAGYHTVHIGKWHLGRSKGFTPNDQGFDESLLMASGLYLPEDSPDGVVAKLPFDPIDKFLWARMQYSASFNSADDTDAFEPGGYITDWWTDQSLDVIEANRNRPFFLYLAHWGVHTPLQATKEDYEAVGDITPHRLRVYAAMVRSLDRSVGRILDKLEAEGLDDNTLIVFSSDNGGAGYVGLPEINAPYRGWKITLFEGGIRVPLFMRWPAAIAPETRITTPVAHVDVMPTLTAAGGAMLPTDVAIDGVNLLPAATGENGISRPDDAIYWSSGFYKVVRAGDWKLQVNERQNKRWLFNLAVDPTEERNLVNEEPAKLADLQGLIDSHWRNARPPLYPHTLESPIRIDETNAETFDESDEYVIWPN